jgi:flagellar biosynthesis chaperone FliJ
MITKTRWSSTGKLKIKTERSNDMAKKKKTKKKVSVLDKIQKSLNKLEALHEKQSDMIFDINELIDDAQMDDDYCDLD